MEIYLVGGAVRDQLLELSVKERDWVVVGATGQDMEALGYRPVAGDFPVYLHPQTGEEYALVRRERKTGPGHKGFTFETGPDVSLEQDLQRRDLTINAMAQAPDGTIIDPFNGRQDLDAGILRHVSPAFVDDPLRLVRVARFAARLGRWGFRVAHGTHGFLKKMVKSGELATLSAERIWRETEQALAEPTPSRYIDTLRRCGALETLFPELTLVLPQAGGHGGREDDPGVGVLKQLDAAADRTDDVPVRLAVLLAQLTLAAPGAEGEQRLAAFLTRLPVPRAHSELARLVAEQFYPYRTAEGAAGILAFLEAVDALRRPARFERFLVACEVFANDRQRIRATRMRRALQAASAVRPQGLITAGIQGPALGAALRKQRLQAIEAVEPP